MERKKCNKCPHEKPLDEFYKQKTAKDGREPTCKSCRKISANKYYAANRDRCRKFQTDWKNKNKKRIAAYQRTPQHRAYINKYNRERRQTDVMFRLKQLLSCRTASAFNGRGWSNTTKMAEMFGCDYNTVKKHIESSFKEGMGWHNRGEWHIDHIIPLSSAKTEKELMALCHYKNTQPLWPEENYKKGIN